MQMNQLFYLSELMMLHLTYFLYIHETSWNVSIFRQASFLLRDGFTCFVQTKSWVWLVVRLLFRVLPKNTASPSVGNTSTDFFFQLSNHCCKSIRKAETFCLFHFPTNTRHRGNFTWTTLLLFFYEFVYKHIDQESTPDLRSFIYLSVYF